MITEAMYADLDDDLDSRRGICDTTHIIRDAKIARSKLSKEESDALYYRMIE